MGRKREPDIKTRVRVARPVGVRERRLLERLHGQRRLPLKEFEDPAERPRTATATTGMPDDSRGQRRRSGATPAPRTRSIEGPPDERRCRSPVLAAPDDQERKHPVQLLCDTSSMYGIGVVSSAVEDGFPKLPEIILRPDRLLEAKTHPAALQMIVGGFRHGMFSHMAEERLRQEIHWEMLRRKGLNWPPDDLRWWSKDPEQQARNRQIYHGLRLSSLAVINRLIGEALRAAAEPHALALARRFRFHQRYEIYRATAASHRALQLTDVFPALGLAIFGSGSSRAKVNLIPEAKRLVEGGAPLRKVSELMGVPTAFRRVKPAPADLALAVVDAFEDPRLITAHMPEPPTKMKLWLNCIYVAQGVGPDFVQWTSRHATEIGGSLDEVIGILRDIADWVRACYRASVPLHIGRLYSAIKVFFRRKASNSSIANSTRTCRSQPSPN